MTSIPFVESEFGTLELANQRYYDWIQKYRKVTVRKRVECGLLKPIYVVRCYL